MVKEEGIVVANANSKSQNRSLFAEEEGKGEVMLVLYIFTNYCHIRNGECQQQKKHEG